MRGRTQQIIRYFQNHPLTTKNLNSHFLSVDELTNSTENKILNNQG